MGHPAVRGHSFATTWLPAVLTALVLGGCNTLPAATPEQAAAWQGTYSGIAVINDPALPGPVCAAQIPISGFTVTGNRVQYLEFGGTIRNDGSLEMVMRQVWIMGRFQPNGFFGQLLVPPTDVCVYRLALSRGS